MLVVSARLSNDNRWSWEGERYPRSLLDHIMISSGLLPFIAGVSLGDISQASDHRAHASALLVLLLWSLRFFASSHCLIVVFTCDAGRDQAR